MRHTISRGTGGRKPDKKPIRLSMDIRRTLSRGILDNASPEPGRLMMSLSLKRDLSRNSRHDKYLAKVLCRLGIIFIIFFFGRASFTDTDCIAGTVHKKTLGKETYNSYETDNCCEFDVVLGPRTNTRRKATLRVICEFKLSDKIKPIKTESATMPGGNSFLKATIEAGGGIKLRKLSGTDDDESVDKANKKRNRKAAQLNNSCNESFTGKIVKERKLSYDDARYDNNSPMSEEAEELVRSEEKLSDQGVPDIDKRLAAQMGHISAVTMRMHGKLRDELLEYDLQNQYTLPSHNATLTPRTSESNDESDNQRLFFSRTVEAATSSGMSSKLYSILKRVNFRLYVVVNTDLGITVRTSRKRGLETVNSIHVSIPKKRMISDEVRNALEKRIQRDADWPVKVGIFATKYQTGDEKFLLNLTEKDSIGKFIDTSVQKLVAQNLRENVATVIEIHDEIRLSAGMAVVNCKNDDSAKWLMRAVASAKRMRAVVVRDHIELQATTIKDAVPFKAFTIINSNKSDSWEVTKEMLAKKGVVVDKLVVVNTRNERNTVYTAVDTGRKVHECLEYGKRMRNFQMLAGNITLKLTYGEDEKCKKLNRNRGQNNLFSLRFQSSSPRVRTNRLSSPTSGSTIAKTLTGTSRKMRTRCNIKSTEQQRTSENELKKDESQCKVQEIVARGWEISFSPMSVELGVKKRFVKSQRIVQLMHRVAHRVKNKKRISRYRLVDGWKRRRVYHDEFRKYSHCFRNEENDVVVKTENFNKAMPNHSCVFCFAGVRGDSGRPKASFDKNEDYIKSSARTVNPSFLALGAAAAGVVSSLMFGLGGGEDYESNSDSSKEIEDTEKGSSKKSSFKFRQINLGKRMAAYTNLNTIIERDEVGKDLQVIFIQEPNKRATISGGKIYKTIDSKIKNIRAAIYVKNELINQGCCHLITELTDGDQVTVDISFKLPEGGKINAVLCSVYMPTDTNCRDMITVKMEKLLKHCKKNGRELIMAMDCNAYCEKWGSKSTNARGETLMDWITKELVLINQGNKPTFLPDPLKPNERSSCIDITVASTNIAKLLNGWKVLDEDSHSDHRWIQFDLSSTAPEVEMTRSKRSTNWNKFCTIINNSKVIKDLTKHSYKMSFDEQDNAAQALMKELIDAFEKSCRITKKRIFKKQPWYNDKLFKLRKKLRKAQRISAKFHENENLRIDARRCKAEYFGACNKARRNSWRQTIEELEEVKDIARMNKFMEKGPTTKVATITKQDGTSTANAQETQDELIKAHFKGVITLDENEDWREERPPELKLTDHEEKAIFDATKLEIILWAIDSLSPFKSPGEDEIFPALLQKSKDIVAQILQILFRASLLSGHIPKVWRGTKVTFIPKPGKESYGTAAAYRPISLMSFIIKILEKVIEKWVRNVELADDPLDDDQHAYRTGRSTESALHNVAYLAEKALESKSYCLMSCVDICGAFNHVTWATIERAALKKGLSRWSIRWIKSMLRNRRLKTTDLSCALRYIPEIGVAQGGSISPLIWVIIADDLIRRLKEGGIRVVGFADDICMMVTGSIVDGLKTKMNEAFQIVNKWCMITGLDVNPDKTEMILFTRKHIFKGERMRVDYPTDVNKFYDGRECVLRGVKLKGREIFLSKSVKYLGVIFDMKLNMNEQLDSLKGKANRALWAANSLCKRNWGLQPKKMLYIYKSIIVPRLTYGCLIFWNKFSNERGNVMRTKNLRTLQRRAIMMITGASKNVPTLPLLAIMDITPLEVLFERRALEAHIRLKRNGSWRGNWASGGHGRLEETAEALELEIEVEEISPRWRPVRLFELSTAIRLNVGNVGEGHVFVDASVKDGNAGFGIYVIGSEMEISGRMMQECSNTQAEMIAIKEGAKRLLSGGLTQKRLVLWTDSLSSIEALKKPLIKRRETWACSEALNELAMMGNTISVNWISKKSGTMALGRADALARRGRNGSGCLLQNFLNESANKLKMDKWEVEEKKKLWDAIYEKEGFTNSKIMLRGFGEERFNDISRFSKRNLRIMIAMLTGAAPLNGFLSKIAGTDPEVILRTDRCRFCHNHKEDMIHLLMSCQHRMIASAREKVMGSALPSEERLKALNSKELLNFATEIKLGDILWIRGTSEDEVSVSQE